jgi:hypothetical protein
MSPQNNSALPWLLAALLAGGATVALLEHHAIARLRAEHETLTGEAAEARRLAAENGKLEQFQAAAAEAQKLREENKDLPALRNEVSQLRREVGELGSLREENRALAVQIKNATSQKEARLPEGFIPKAAMGDAGQGSPEATIQTFLWAMSQGNVERLTQCAFDGDKAALPGPDAERQRQEMSRQMQDFPGFVIAEKTVVSATEIIITVKSSANGPGMPFTLRNVAGLWKVQ